MAASAAHPARCTSARSACSSSAAHSNSAAPAAAAAARAPPTRRGRRARRAAELRRGVVDEPAERGGDEADRPTAHRVGVRLRPRRRPPPPPSAHAARCTRAAPACSRIAAQAAPSPLASTSAAASPSVAQSPAIATHPETARPAHFGWRCIAAATRFGAPCSSNAARSSFRSPKTQRRPVACSATPSSVGPTCAIAAHASATAPRPTIRCAASSCVAASLASAAHPSSCTAAARVVGECGDDPVDAARRDDRLRGVDVAAEVGEGGAPLRLQLDVGLVGVEDGDDERGHAVLHQSVDRLLRRLAGEVGDGADALEGDLGVRLVAGERVDEPRAARRLQSVRRGGGEAREVGSARAAASCSGARPGAVAIAARTWATPPASVIVCRLRRWWHASSRARGTLRRTDGCAAVASIAAHISFTSSALATPRIDRVCFHRASRASAR